MKASKKPQIKAALLANPQGLTVEAVADIIGSHANVVRAALKTLDVAYIDRWEPRAKMPWMHVAYWKAVVVPAHAERPVAQKTDQQ